MNSKESMDHHINDSHYIYIIGGLEHFLFFHILGMSYSQLTFIFFRGVGKPPTRNCVSYICIDGMHTHTLPHCMRGGKW